MRKHSFLAKILVFVLSCFMIFSLVSCNNTPEEYVDPDEGKMPDFNYIIFPLLTQAEDVYGRIFSSVEYGNKSIMVGDTTYYFVEPSEYENESFDSLFRGIFTEQYAEEYIEMMYGGDNPLYVEQDGYLYVNPEKIVDFERVNYNTDTCSVSGYVGTFAKVTVKTDIGDSVTFDVRNNEGIWYLDCMIR